MKFFAKDKLLFNILVILLDFNNKMLIRIFILRKELIIFLFKLFF